MLLTSRVYTQGDVSSSTYYPFRGPHLDRFATSGLYHLSVPPGYVYVGIDPSGGGQQSDYAIVSIVYDGIRAIIIAMDTVSSDDSLEVEQMVYHHLAGIRSIPLLRPSVIRVYVEINHSLYEGSRILRQCSKYRFSPIEMQTTKTGSGSKLGVFTSHATKQAYVDIVTDLLRDESLHFTDSPVPPHTQELSFTTMSKLLVEQLKAFRKIKKTPRDKTADVNTVYFSGKGQGRKDDLLLALMIALYFSGLDRNDPAFRESCRARNIVNY